MTPPAPRSSACPVVCMACVGARGAAFTRLRCRSLPSDVVHSPPLSFTRLLCRSLAQIFIADRSPFSAVFYGSNGHLLEPVIREHLREVLAAADVLVFTVYLQVPSRHPNYPHACRAVVMSSCLTRCAGGAGDAVGAHFGPVKARAGACEVQRGGHVSPSLSPLARTIDMPTRDDRHAHARNRSCLGHC